MRSYLQLAKSAKLTGSLVSETDDDTTVETTCASGMRGREGIDGDGKKVMVQPFIAWSAGCLKSEVRHSPA